VRERGKTVALGRTRHAGVLETVSNGNGGVGDARMGREARRFEGVRRADAIGVPGQAAEYRRGCAGVSISVGTAQAGPKSFHFKNLKSVEIGSEAGRLLLFAAT
jgi:hypothetical protein